MNDTLQLEATVEQAVDLGLREDEFVMIKNILVEHRILPKQLSTL